MNPITRLAVRLGAQPWLPRLARYIVGSDRLIQRVSRGHLTLLMVAGLPELMLHVAGRRSGIERSTPLLCVPHQDGWLVAGSNWGAEKPPVWVGNLVAAETAAVTYRGRRRVVVPVLLAGQRRDEAWAVMLATWPNYAKYAERTDREIRVFHLTPTAG